MAGNNQPTDRAPIEGLTYLMDRTILHCDLNAFYASVECLYRPELKEVPMAVGGDVENRRGIILAKNELAKGCGVVTAETIWQAQRKCPQLVIVGPHFDRYHKYSRLVNELYYRFTDKIEPFGIDESWLDVSGSLHLFGSGREIADQIRELVRSELGLTVSVGVSFNKVFAKLGSDYKKPDATTVIDRNNYRQIVNPLPVSDLLFVGRAAAAMLAKLGIKTIGELAGCDRQLLAARLGRMGEKIHDYANGVDPSPVGAAGQAREAKSIGNGITFRRNLIGLDDITTGVAVLSDTVAGRLRKSGLKCRTVQVTIRDPQFRTISRQKRLDRATHLAKEIAAASVAIIKEAWNLEKPIRMLTITGLQLVEGDQYEQPSLFSTVEDKQREKIEKIEEAVDAIRDRFGQDSIVFGAGSADDLGIRRPRDK